MKNNNKLKILVSFSLSFFLFSMISSFIWSYYIPSESMYPNISIGDYTLSTRFNTLETGEVYSFVVDSSYIKRLIAQEGDTIQFKRTLNKKYDIFINGKKLEQIQINADELPENKLNSILEFYGHTDFDFFIETINNRSYFVMYKHHDHISDNVIENYLLNEFSYTLKENETFFLGDNRNDSADSRYYGVIKTDQIKRHSSSILFNKEFLINKDKRYFFEKI